MALLGLGPKVLGVDPKPFGFGPKVLVVDPKPHGFGLKVLGVCLFPKHRLSRNHDFQIGPFLTVKDL